MLCWLEQASSKVAVTDLLKIWFQRLLLDHNQSILALNIRNWAELPSIACQVYGG